MHILQSLPVMLIARRFAPRQVSSDNVFWFSLFLGALVMLLVARKVLSIIEADKAEKAKWQHIRSVLHEHGIKDKIAESVIKIIRTLKHQNPEHAVTSLKVFDRHIEATLRSSMGRAAAKEIRRRLFFQAVSGVLEYEGADDDNSGGDDENALPSLPDEDTIDRRERNEAIAELVSATAVHAPPNDLPGADISSELNLPRPEKQVDPALGSGSLVPGTNLSVRFENQPAGCNCGVVTVAREGFVVTLPRSKGTILQPELGEWTECILQRNDEYYFFRSRVLEISYSNLPVCRLSHTARMQGMKMTEFARAGLSEPVQFYCFGPKSVERDLTDSNKGGPGANNDIRGGFLRDLSPGGCCLDTAEMEPLLETGHLLRFPLPLLDDGRPEEVLGRVVNIQPAAEAEGRQFYRVQVELIGLHDALRDRIVRAAHRLHKG